MLKSDHIFHSAVNIMMSLQVPDTKDQDSLCHAACHVEWIQERRHHSKGAVSKSRESEFCCENDAEGDCLWFPLNECHGWMNWMIVCAFVELLIVFAFAEWMIVCVFAEWMKWIIVWCTYLLIFLSQINLHNIYKCVLFVSYISLLYLLWILAHSLLIDKLMIGWFLGAIFQYDYGDSWDNHGMRPIILGYFFQQLQWK